MLDRKTVRTALIGAFSALTVVAGVTVVTLYDGGANDVSYARMMAIHHSQAVEMSLQVMSRGSDRELHIVATDALLTQQNQVGRFQQFLDERGKVSMLEPGVVMEGMLSDAEMAELYQLQGAELDNYFIQKTIMHHLGGVAMSEAALSEGLSGQMERLANAVVNAQAAEIRLLRQIATRISAGE